MQPQTILFLFATIAALVAASFAETGEGGFKGYYELVTNLTDEKYAKYLEAMGLNEESRHKIQSSKMVKIRISQPKGSKYTFERKVDINILRINFESGKEFEANLGDGDGTKVKNTITVDPAAKTAKRVIKLPGGGEATQDTTFTPDGFTLTMKCKEAVAELKFKRLVKAKSL